MPFWKNSNLLATLLTIALLYGCGDHRRPLQSGTAVDPYIVDAQFQEILDDGTAGQLSSFSEDDGTFSFPQPLAPDSTVVMVIQGTHNGVPFSGTLKTDLMLAEDALILSPLTTLMTNLLATGLPAEEVQTTTLHLLSGSGLNLAPQALDDDPVQAARHGDTQLLQANLATNAFLGALQRAGENGYYLTENSGYLEHLNRRSHLLVNLVSAIRSCLRPEHLHRYQATLPEDYPEQWRPSEQQLIKAAASYADFLQEQVTQALADGTHDLDLQSLLNEAMISELIHNHHLAEFINDSEFIAYMEGAGYNLEGILSGEAVRLDENGRACPKGNAAPVANAGPDQEAVRGIFSFNPVRLDGSGSKDPDGDPLTYSWELQSTPGGSRLDTTSLISTDSIDPTFTPDMEGDYQLQLIVNDGNLDSAPDTVVVTAPGCSGHSLCGF